MTLENWYLRQKCIHAAEALQNPGKLWIIYAIAVVDIVNSTWEDFMPREGSDSNKWSYTMMDRRVNLFFAWNTCKNGREVILLVDERVLMSQLAIEKSLNISFFQSPN